MTVLVFAGPTLPPADITARLDCVVLPPAGQGDLWRAVQRHRPTAIGLIDGVFRGRRAVWHREILWALSHGVHVLGAASMGALRAAELAPFGMRGVGRVYEAYRDGVWPGEAAPFEDDDEVAVEHAPGELGHAPLSVAMVDIRDSLLAAEAAGALSRDDRIGATAAVKALHYPKRSLAAAEAAAGIALGQFYVPRKRLDALDLLDELAAVRKPFEPAFAFQPTMIWDRFVAEDADSAEPIVASVLDQLRLDPAAWRATCLAAHGRAVTHQPPADIHHALSTFRMARGLALREDLNRWMADNGLDEDGLAAFLSGDPDRIPPAPGTRWLAAELRATGQFAALIAAAEARSTFVLPPPSPMEIDAALDWYHAKVSIGRGSDPVALGWRDAPHFEANVVACYRAAMARARGAP